MRIRLVLASFVFLTFGGQAASAVEWIDRIPLENIIPPPPPRGSQAEKDEIAEILRARAMASPAALAQAVHDDGVEDPSIFSPVLGPAWNLNNLPKTKFLLDRIMDVDRPDSSTSKHYFHRTRPWAIEPRNSRPASRMPVRVRRSLSQRPCHGGLRAWRGDGVADAQSRPGYPGARLAI